MHPRLSIKIPSRTIASLILSKARRAAQEVTRQLPNAVRTRLEAEADKVLGSTAGAYKAGLQVTVNRGGITVRISRGLPASLETGFDQFDLKPGMLARAHKFSKRTGEPYIDVPLGASRAGVARMRKTIRRISARSDPASWLHPGFKGVKAFERLGPTIQQEVKDLFSDALKKAK